MKPGMKNIGCQRMPGFKQEWLAFGTSIHCSCRQIPKARRGDEEKGLADDIPDSNSRRNELEKRSLSGKISGERDAEPWSPGTLTLVPFRKA